MNNVGLTITIVDSFKTKEIIQVNESEKNKIIFRAPWGA